MSLRREKIITTWSDRKILPVQEFETEINKKRFFGVVYLCDRLQAE
ncbi:hypothetical protein [Nostoc sp. UHCC 0870]|nr:hypothetical protein [Nostoc sp. UHCC 0870]UKO98316.1 hypothetical protein L6494_00765 [Nostoc sp. UHCC 0870]